MAEKSAKPKLEDVINEVLSESVCDNALDFVAFLRANKMTTPWSAKNSWKICFKGKNMGFMSTSGTAAYRGLGENSWHICFTDSEFANDDTACGEQCVLSEKQKDTIWNTLRNCQKCPYLCNPGKSMTIFGRKFDSVCHQWLSLVNPNAETLDCVKKWFYLYKNSIINGGKANG